MASSESKENEMTGKTYYIVESTSGALGAIGTNRRMSGRFTNKVEAKSVLKELKRLNKNKRIIYWIDFYWND